MTAGFTTEATPPRHEAQRVAALERANHVRCARRRFRRDLAVMPLAEALLAAARVVLTPPAWAEAWELGDFLMALPRVGRAGSERALTHAGIRLRGLGQLTDRQRTVLVMWLEDLPGAPARGLMHEARRRSGGPA